jgi:hypothetical protein
LHYNTAYKLEKTTKFNHPCKLTFLWSYIYIMM